MTFRSESRPNILRKAEELGEQLGISTSSVYRRRSLAEPLPPAIRIGSSIRWRQSDIDAWIEQQLESSVD